MVRRIRSCETCHLRFVALANSPLCSNCCGSDGIDNSSSLQAKNEEVAFLDSDGIDCSETESMKSEGGDEIHCTQLVQEDDAESSSHSTIEQQLIPVTAAVLDEGNKHSISKKACEAQRHTMLNDTNSASATGDVCFICGTSLSSLKRRLDHIKRCSKKHSITGRDVKVNTELDAFEAVSNESRSKACSSSLNPYTKGSSWHGDANLTLKIAASTEGTAMQESCTEQTVLTSFFNHPVKNINNILLAGARRMTKTAELVAANKSKQLFRGRKRQRGSFGGRNYTFDCPMYKKIPGTDFVCDGFHYAKSSLTQNYFLTHFHADHYGGIGRSWNTGIIYCSLPTAELVAQQIGVDRKYLHPLPMNVPTIVASRGKPITVTLLDANHCPGAVMFLFHVGKRHILHVGDFRWNREIMLHPGSRLKVFASEQSILDELFLDTTYCNPKYALPSQTETIEAIQTLFQKELNLGKQNASYKTLHLFGAYTIGKEKMYLSIADHYGLKVYVDARRYRILSVLGWPKERMASLTTNKEEASIWVVPLGDINMKRLPEYFPMANSKPFAAQYTRIVGYRPTGWSMGSKPSSSLVTSRQNENLVIHSVPYSEHSSFPELVDCLACLRPQKIVPTVNAGKSEEQVKLLLKALHEKQTTLPFREVLKG